MFIVAVLIWSCHGVTGLQQQVPYKKKKETELKSDWNQLSFITGIKM